MQEDFLHYIWQFKKLDVLHLKTVQKESLEIVSVGQHNKDGGPDFFNAQLKIGNQLWAGNVEVHIKSSDWFAHHHETDKAYDNVILHVVWEHDTEVYREDQTLIPTLVLQDYVQNHLLDNYRKLFAKQQKWINCENDMADVETLILEHWLERLYFERLERKSEAIFALLKASKQDWEAVLFQLLAKNFGLKVNGDAFFSMAKSIDFTIVRKVQNNPDQLEALLFGQAGLLESEVQNPYYLNLVREYRFLKQKFQLDNEQVLQLRFFRLRPPNFPTVRLSQLAMLYHKQLNLFSKVIETETLAGLYELFKVETSGFWKTHYTFEKQSKASAKCLTKPFMDLLVINTILPLKYCHARHMGIQVDEQISTIASAIASEENTIIKAFDRLGKRSGSAMQSQALIQLKTAYCDKNRCLQCAVGNVVLMK